MIGQNPVENDRAINIAVLIATIQNRWNAEARWHPVGIAQAPYSLMDAITALASAVENRRHLAGRLFPWSR